jgi:transcriptional regulator with XRE-family HTH domain
MTFGEYLKELRQAKGISQKELSSLTKGQVSNAEISRLEAGIRKKPSPAVLKMLSPHLGVPVSFLLREAGFMEDQLPETLEEQDEALTADGEAPAGLQGTASEKEAFMQVNRKLKEQLAALEKRCQELTAANKELEDKCGDFWLRSQSVSKGSDEIEEENRSLKEKNDNLKEENRRIKEETIVFLAEGTALRAEAENFRKKITMAEEEARNAKRQQEILEEECRLLKERDEESRQQLEMLPGKAAALAETQSDWQEKKEKLENEIRKLKGDALDMLEILRKSSGHEAEEAEALQQQLEEHKKAAAEKVKEITGLQELVAEKLQEIFSLQETVAGKDRELASLKETLDEKAQEISGLQETGAEKDRELAGLKETLDEKAQEISDLQEALAKRTQEAAGLKEQTEELSQARELQLQEKKTLEEELLVEKEINRKTVTFADILNEGTVKDRGLGKIFANVLQVAPPEDLDMIGRLLQAMEKDAIKPIDKKMLLDILKRFIK